MEYITCKTHEKTLPSDCIQFLSSCSAGKGATEGEKEKAKWTKDHHPNPQEEEEKEKKIKDPLKRKTNVYRQYE